MMSENPTMSLPANYIISAILSGKPNTDMLKNKWGQILAHLMSGNSPTPVPTIEMLSAWQAVLDRCGIRSIAFVPPQEQN